MNEERIREQRAEIRRLNESLKDFRILAGIEVDIRADGSLDLPDEILAEHGHRGGSSAFGHGAGAGEDDQANDPGDGESQRGHHRPPHVPPPRGKGSHRPRHGGHLPRGGQQTGTALEINAMPDRLDLKDIHIFRARELGVKLSLGTDAHATEHLPLMRFGVGIARRGWAGAGHILNTLSAEDVLAALKH